MFDDVKVEAVFHQGACSDTMEYDGRYMMTNNYTYSKELFNFCTKRRIPFLYASSAATYGDSTVFVEARENENTLNVYGYSKLQFDRHVQRVAHTLKSTVVGLRYFNVYGPREVHKGKMASQAYQLRNQVLEQGHCTLFGASHGYDEGGHLRDFVWVGDVVDVNFHFAFSEQPVQAVVNCGCGKARSFRDVGDNVVRCLKKGEVRFKEMPDVLKDKYQAYTCADTTQLRKAGYTKEFTALEDGITAYMNWLDAHPQG
ncbi:MAG: ADP-glyceromanno-heptose 6-epimerase [Magnetococcales bacterium]|nr:ADP-glyceromanno-heptose 6-epimerase [Magnetococcales bacterium]